MKSSVGIEARMAEVLVMNILGVVRTTENRDAR